MSITASYDAVKRYLKVEISHEVVTINHPLIPHDDKQQLLLRKLDNQADIDITICRAIVANSGGQLELTSIDDNKITLIMPMKKDHSSSDQSCSEVSINILEAN